MSPRRVFDVLHAAYGPQQWWPADGAFEVMVGAILTQNTAWTNVERAIANLKENNCLDPVRLARTPHARLAKWLRPSGYFNIKATRLHNFCRWYLDQGGYESLATLQTPELRHRLLSVNGVGPETADDMVLYAFARPVFVIDAYTRRLFQRLGLIGGDEGYETLRHYFEEALGRTKRSVRLFEEYHALIVEHAKTVCRKRPDCPECCLITHCPAGQDAVQDSASARRV